MLLWNALYVTMVKNFTWDNMNQCWWSWNMLRRHAIYEFIKFNMKLGLIIYWLLMLFHDGIFRWYNPIFYTFICYVIALYGLMLLEYLCLTGSITKSDVWTILIRTRLEDWQDLCWPNLTYEPQLGLWVKIRLLSWGRKSSIGTLFLFHVITLWEF